MDALSLTLMVNSRVFTLNGGVYPACEAAAAGHNEFIRVSN